MTILGIQSLDAMPSSHFLTNTDLYNPPHPPVTDHPLTPLHISKEENKTSTLEKKGMLEQRH